MLRIHFLFQGISETFPVEVSDVVLITFQSNAICSSVWELLYPPIYLGQAKTLCLASRACNCQTAYLTIDHS